MKRALKLGLWALLLVFTLGVLPALAADFFVQNQLDGRASVAVHYFDTARGAWVTRGWIVVGGHSERKVTYNDVSPEHTVYYNASYGGDICIDRAHAGRKAINKWTSNEPFVFYNDDRGNAAGKLTREPFIKVDYSRDYKGYLIRLNSVPNG